MSGFQNNVISNNGRSLIASATAADPIIMVGFVASATAYTALQLESATLADFEITGGTIKSCNAEGLIARIIGTIKNQPSVVTAKSFAVVARRSSQSAASNVILASVSDPNANIRIPSTSEPSVGINVPVNITTALSGTVQVVSGSAAAPSDLDRFVSLYSAGNPSTGDAQHIKGEKEFEELLVDTNFGVGSDASCLISCPLETEDKVIVEQALTIGYNYIKGDKTQSTSTPQLVIKNDTDADTKAAINFYKYKDESNSWYGRLNFMVDNFSHSSDHYVDLWPTIYQNGDEKPSRIDIRFDTITMDAVDQIYPLTNNYTDLGTSLRKFKNVYSTKFTGDLDGRIPQPAYTTGSTQTIPVGGLCLAYISSMANLNSLEVGETFTISSPNSGYLTASNSWGSSWGGNKFLGAGTYRALSELQGGSPTEGVVLVMRIS